MAAHLFVFYFSCLAVITPPVAIAAYAAAPIAEGNASRVGWLAFRLGIAAYIVPFMFVYGPELLSKGSLPAIMLAVATSIVGIFGLAVAAGGWFKEPLKIYLRVAVLAASLMLIVPGLYSDLAGLGGLCLLYGLQVLRMRVRASVTA